MCLYRTFIYRQPLLPENWRDIVDYLEILPDIIRADSELVYWIQQWEQHANKTISEAISDSLNELRTDITIAENYLPGTDRSELETSYEQLARMIGCLDKETSGSAPKTALLAAYIASLYEKRPYEGIVRASNLQGSDTDTIATMAGAIMGITAEEDPPEYVRDIEYIEKMASDMYQVSQGKSIDNHSYPNLGSWRPPNSNIDTIGKLRDDWYMPGLGRVTEEEELPPRKEDNGTIWQWFKLEFGQSILVKRRANVRALKDDVLPVRKIMQDTAVQPVQGRMDDVIDGSQTKDSKVVNENQATTLDAATDQIIRGEFDNAEIGKLLKQLAVQEAGLEKVIAYASIVAKAWSARVARSNRSRKSDQDSSSNRSQSA